MDEGLGRMSGAHPSWHQVEPADLSVISLTTNNEVNLYSPLASRRDKVGSAGESAVPGRKKMLSAGN